MAADNSCLLDAIAQSGGHFKGIAIIDFDASLDELRALKAQGVLGAAFNTTFYGTDYYKKSEDLIRRLAELDMFLQIQSEHDQLSMFVPWIEEIPVKVLITIAGGRRRAKVWGNPDFNRCCDIARTTG